MKILIKNGSIVDGSGAPRYAASLVVENELIASIGSIEHSSGIDQVIDAKGMIVAPGFIDTHSHSDLQVMVNPYVEAKVRQGVTTELLGLAKESRRTRWRERRSRLGLRNHRWLPARARSERCRPQRKLPHPPRKRPHGSHGPRQSQAHRPGTRTHEGGDSARDGSRRLWPLNRAHL